MERVKTETRFKHKDYIFVLTVSEDNGGPGNTKRTLPRAQIFSSPNQDADRRGEWKGSLEDLQDFALSLDSFLLEKEVDCHIGKRGETLNAADSRAGYRDRSRSWTPLSPGSKAIEPPSSDDDSVVVTMKSIDFTRLVDRANSILSTEGRPPSSPGSPEARARDLAALVNRVLVQTGDFP